MLCTSKSSYCLTHKSNNAQPLAPPLTGHYYVTLPSSGLEKEDGYASDNKRFFVWEELRYLEKKKQFLLGEEKRRRISVLFNHRMTSKKEHMPITFPCEKKICRRLRPESHLRTSEPHLRSMKHINFLFTPKVDISQVKRSRSSQHSISNICLMTGCVCVCFCVCVLMPGID